MMNEGEDILPRSFYHREAPTVARDLLGRELVCVSPEGESSGIIVESEAYLGARDPASHTFGGRRTPRTEVLFGPAGRAYIYLVYGLHLCLNLTTGDAGAAGCVLIRALEPAFGTKLMNQRRGGGNIERLASGPGRLCKALGIGRELNGTDLLDGRLFLREGRRVPEAEIVTSTRIGIEYAGEARDWPLRFYVRGNPSVSRK